MSKKPKPALDDRASPRPKTIMAAHLKNAYFGRDGLLAYIQEPEGFPPSRVIHYNEDWVLIHDLYPKASVHLLLMPRKEEWYTKHPLHAFEDPAFLASTRAEVQKAVAIAASALRHLHSAHSLLERPRHLAMAADDPPPVLPEGRDYTLDIRTGIHANPSMNHLHIHILSRDMHSDALKKRQHYNSFNTQFFCQMADMPMEGAEQERVRGKAVEDLHADLRCWRCGEGFGNGMARFKEHLDEEFEAWRRE